MADYTSYRPSTSEGFSAQPNALDSVHRSFTRGSHYSHATASTMSWVQNTQQNPPPPPQSSYDPEQTLSPARTSRPLPQPQLRPQTFHTVNATEPPDDDDEEYMNIDPNGPGMQYEYQTEGMIPSHRVLAGSPEVEPVGPKKQRSFVGGFVHRLRRLPRKMLGYGVSNEKRRHFPQGAFGTDADTSVTGMTTGNTLPLYRSNPSSPVVAGPSNIQYVQAMGLPPPAGPPPQSPPEELPHSLLSGAALRRAQPSFRVTPPSESISHESAAQIFQSPQPQFAQVVHPDPMMTNNAERTTVMVYSDPTDSSTVEAAPLQRVPSRRPDPVRNSGTTARTPSIKIQTPAPPPPINVPATEEEVQSPATEHPLPTADYRKMSNYPASPSRKSMFTATGTSFYDPSFTSDLSPVERFFKTFYHLPWVSHGRVTIDYRPGEGFQGKGRKNMIKKPMASWYRRLSRSSRNAELDLLSNGTPGTTPRTSLQTSFTAGLASPRSNRTRQSRSSSERHHHHDQQQPQRRRHHRGHHHRRAHTMSTMTEEEMTRAPSPVLPAVYPYAYPAYPYTYPGYAAMPPALPAPPGFAPPAPAATSHPAPAHGPIPAVANVSASTSKRSPRGPRSHRSPTYPHGYAPYQPMAFPQPPPPPQIYVVQSSPTMSNASGPQPEGGTPPQQGRVLTPFYLPMQVVPGGFGSDYHDALSSAPSSPPPRGTAATPAQPQ